MCFWSAQLWGRSVRRSRRPSEVGCSTRGDGRSTTSQELRASGEEKTVAKPGVYSLIGVDDDCMHRDPHFSNSNSNLNPMGGDRTEGDVHVNEDVGLQEREVVVVGHRRDLCNRGWGWL